MSSPEERVRHSRRIKKKKIERVRSIVAKELVTNKRYRQQVVRDKRGREVVTFHDLVKAIQEDE